MVMSLDTGKSGILLWLSRGKVGLVFVVEQDEFGRSSETKILGESGSGPC